MQLTRCEQKVSEKLVNIIENYKLQIVYIVQYRVLYYIDYQRVNLRKIIFSLIHRDYFENHRYILSASDR